MDNDFPTTDWLTKGIPENQLLKEKIEALEDVIRFFNKWHPYPKEKPSEQGFYLITEPIMLNSKEYQVQIYYWGKSWECEEIDPKLKKKKAYWIYSDSEWGDHECDDVVAWMPLPEPYVPKEKKQ